MAKNYINMEVGLCLSLFILGAFGTTSDIDDYTGYKDLDNKTIDFGYIYPNTSNGPGVNSMYISIKPHWNCGIQFAGDYLFNNAYIRWRYPGNTTMWSSWKKIT